MKQHKVPALRHGPVREWDMPVLNKWAAAAVLGCAMSGTAAQAEEAADAPALPALALPLSGSIVGNPAPLSFELPNVGKIYVTGVGSGLYSAQSHPIFGDKSDRGDITNAQVFVQKAEGVFQFFLQAGLYSLPSLGAGYVKAETITDATFGALPQAYIKIAPTDSFSIQAGKMPTLQGAEYTFTFQNWNIDRGLLWNQENAVTRGVQANFVTGKLALSVSLTDGYYSGKLNWLGGLATYTIDPNNILAFAASGALSYNDKSTFRTPFFQNNGQVYNVIYTHTAGKLVVQPYLQFTHIPRLQQVGSTSADTYSGALLLKYAFSPNFNLPVRGEYIASSGRVGSAAPNLLYGQGSNAWSFTVTPTVQYGLFFARAEGSYVRATSSTPGFAFGEFGTERTQVRGKIEVGVLF